MLRWMVVGLIAGSAYAVFAEESEISERTPVALEVSASLDARVRRTDGMRYEAYLRTLLRGLVPEMSIVSEGSDARAATHWIRVQFGRGPTPQVMTVSFEVQAVVGGVRQTARELSSTAEFPIDKPAAVEQFLRSEATRVVASGFLRRVPQAHPVPAARSTKRPVPMPLGRDPDRRVGTASQRQSERTVTEARRLAPQTTTQPARRPYRSYGTIAAGFGLSLVAAGFWQGMLARNAETEFDAATTQVAANEAKAASERHAWYANGLYASGAVLAIAGVTTVILDVLGTIGQPRTRNDPTYPAVAIVPMPGGAIGLWSTSFP